MEKYCLATYQTKRLPTRDVWVGNIAIGSSHPIRIQSMITANTNDTQACVEQILRLNEKGCEMVRLTVQGKKEAANLENIKNALINKGYDIPLIADIHFYPPAALMVADFVDKVRINPGNFLDRRATFKKLTYTEQSYKDEIKRIEEGFLPLVEKCKKRNIALRIGTNHGSLSDRIMNYYGDTPEGMVISAMEYAEICRAHDFHNFLFSMKSSNPLVMIQAYRLLVHKMLEKGWDYPLHLGVTEAGEGEDGRIKSAVGIGSLLIDGLGDTLRVSLTEDPWEEVDPCKKLIDLAQEYQQKKSRPFTEKKRNPFSIDKRPKFNYPFHPDGTIFLCATNYRKDDLHKIEADTLLFPSLPSKDVRERLPEKISLFVEKVIDEHKSLILPFSKEGSFLQKPFGLKIASRNLVDQIDKYKPDFLLLSPENDPIHETRAICEQIEEKIPRILAFKDSDLTATSCEYGSLLCDHLADGICILGDSSILTRQDLSFSILQACRMRSNKTEFISCPSCGRTLFNLQEVSRRIREKTDHLPGVKIAIMGCIVNGPGEMADADFGYVGSKPGKIDLYIGKTCVKRGIDSAHADEELISLIKSEGKWVNP